MFSPPLMITSLIRSRQAFVLRPWLAEGNEGRGLGETVHVNDVPSETILEGFDRGGRRWRPGYEHAHPARHVTANVRGRVGQADEHGWCRTQRGDALTANQGEHAGRLDLRERVGRAADRGDGPEERPTRG